MGVEVAVALARLSLRGAPPDGSPRETVMAILDSLERELDARIDHLAETVLIPRVEIDLRVGVGDRGAFAQVVGRALAERIIALVRLTSDTRRAPLTASGLTISTAPMSVERGRALVAAAREAALGSSSPSTIERSGAPPGGVASPPQASAAHEWIAEVLAAEEPCARLSRVLRERGRSWLVRRLSPDCARVMLDHVRERLSRRIEGSAVNPDAGKFATAAHAAERVREAWARALSSLRALRAPSPGGTAEPTPQEAWVLAVADLGRVVDRLIERTPSIADSLSEAIAGVEGADSRFNPHFPIAFE